MVVSFFSKFIAIIFENLPMFFPRLICADTGTVLLSMLGEDRRKHSRPATHRQKNRPRVCETVPVSASPCHTRPSRCFSASRMKAGMNFSRSSMMQMSEFLNMAASGSRLMETTVLESFMPAICCMEPDMPQAT